jgi:hypothetical protein
VSTTRYACNAHARHQLQSASLLSITRRLSFCLTDLNPSQLRTCYAPTMPSQIARRSSSGALRVTWATATDLRATVDLFNRINLMLAVQPHFQKYSPSRLTQIKSTTLAVSSHSRGVSRSSRTRGGMRWTRAALLTRALTCGRRSRVVLTPRRRRQVCEKKRRRR